MPDIDMTNEHKLICLGCKYTRYFRYNTCFYKARLHSQKYGHELKILDPDGFYLESVRPVDPELLSDEPPF